MTDHPLSVLYYCGDRGLDLTKGEGYRIHVLKILEGLRALGHRPFLLTVNNSDHVPGFVDYQTVPHRYMPGAHHLLPYTGTLDSLAMYRATMALNRERRFDVIHERFGLYSSGAVLASRRLNIPLVLEVNGPTIEEKQLFTRPIAGAQLAVARFIRDLGARQASRIIVVSGALKGFLVENWKGVSENKIVVMPNAADVRHLENPEDVSGLRAGLGLQDAFVVGFLGTFQPWYGLENLIEAFAGMLRQIPHGRLLMVGDGLARETLEKQTAALGISHAVLFTGYAPYDQVPRYLGCFDVATAAFRELSIGFYGSPIKLFEYMAAGRPIVASRLGQIPEIVEHERTALLVEPGNVSELTAALIRLAQDAGLRERLGGAAHAEGRRYSWEAYAGQLADVYRQAKDRAV